MKEFRDKFLSIASNSVRVWSIHVPISVSLGPKVFLCDFNVKFDHS